MSIVKVPDRNELEYLQRKAVRMAREREEWVARRRKENAARAAQGLSALPEEDFSLPFFQTAARPERGFKDPLEGVLFAAQINSYTQNVARFSYDTLPKLFLAHAISESSSSAAGGAP